MVFRIIYCFICKLLQAWLHAVAPSRLFKALWAQAAPPEGEEGAGEAATEQGGGWLEMGRLAPACAHWAALYRTITSGDVLFEELELAAPLLCRPDELHLFAVSAPGVGGSDGEHVPRWSLLPANEEWEASHRGTFEDWCHVAAVRTRPDEIQRSLTLLEAFLDQEGRRGAREAAAALLTLSEELQGGAWAGARLSQLPSFMEKACRTPFRFRSPLFSLYWPFLHALLL